MKTVISVKIDKDVRDKARRVAKGMGVPLSTIINAQLKKLAWDRSFVFETEESYRMSKSLEKRLKKIDADLRARLNLSKGFSETKEMDRYLDALK